ncbi:hypothetical protein H5T87_02235 [bacterium]|nr:hypothetical protein [bacterium]
MDIDRLVQLVEAEVRRLLTNQEAVPPPVPSSQGKLVLVISLHNSPPQDFLDKLRREGKSPLIWSKNQAIDAFEEIWLVNVKWADVAKISLGLFDTPPLEAVLNLLLQGKTPIVEPLTIPPQCPQALAELLRSHWEKILSLGIRTPQASKPASSLSPSPRTIITQEDIWESKEKGLQVLVIPQGSIVTDMARELAERLGIQIKEEEGN